jgi:hypothetical protein
MEKLATEAAKLSRNQKIDQALSAFTRKFPKAEFGRPVTKAEEEEILGYGPHGEDFGQTDIVAALR